MQQEFGKWRSFFWPIYLYELKKVLPMLFMLFFITFNYTLLRDTKDTLVITAPGSGAEVIPFIKVWLVVPIAILLMLLYAKLSNVLSKQALFYVTLTSFLAFFALFAFVFYPAREFLHPTTSADYLEQILPGGFKGLIALYRNWTFAIFYVLAELWGSVILSLVFWGFANDITKVSEAKRFYTLFALGGNTAPIFAGLAMIGISNARYLLPESVDAWSFSLEILVGLVILSGLFIAGCYAWVHKYVLTDSRFFDAAKTKQQSEKPKMSLKESFLFLSKSKYIGCIALLVICYGIAMNLIEVTWKHQVKLQYPHAADYSNFMGHFSTYTGVASFLMILFVGGNIIRRFGWNVAALVTPVVLLITGVLFFSFVLFSDTMSPFIYAFGSTPLMYAVIIGTVQNILCKCTKYSLFDPTKEMAYIPLDEESKVKGKAAIEVVGSRLGKFGGSVIQQGLIVLLGSISAMTPYIALIMTVIIILWMSATSLLNKQFQAVTNSFLKS